MKFSFTAKLEAQESSLGWNHFVYVPEDIALQLIEGSNRRVLSSYNQLAAVPQAIMPANGIFYLFLNQALRNRLKAKTGDMLEVCLCRDESEYGMPMPEEMLEVLIQDAQFHQYFHNLTRGKQRTLIYLVSKVKNTDSRIRKSLAIAAHLNDTLGMLDFKLLNEKIKAFNKL
jgi:hypothetical protein